MQKKKPQLRLLFNGLFDGSEQVRSALLLSGWGFCALMAFLFALSAFQYRQTGFPGPEYAQIPLPPGGDVATTASIGPSGGVPASRFDVFNATSPTTNALSNRMDAELETLRQEIIALRRSTEAMRQLNEQLSGRINQLEGEPGPTAALPPVSKGTRRTPAGLPQVRRSANGFAAPTANSAPRSDFGIALGDFYSLDDAEKAWSALMQTEASIIGQLSPLAAVEQRSNGMVAHLLAGPFANAAEAAATCARLAAREIECKPTLYAGQRLSMR